jgi:hypothetical protein
MNMNIGIFVLLHKTITPFMHQYVYCHVGIFVLLQREQHSSERGPGTNVSGDGRAGTTTPHGWCLPAASPASHTQSQTVRNYIAKEKYSF